MRRVIKPWGHEDIWAETEKYVGKIMKINAGHRMSLQYHDLKEETVYVNEGTLRIWHSDNESDFTDIVAGQIYHVPPKTVHRFGATSAPVLLTEISTPELDDVVRLADDYKR